MELFPFENIRKEQDVLIKKVKDCLESGHHLIVQAPTGIGKTAGVLPAALEYGIKNNKTVFFLTSRHTQHEIVLETLRKIKQKYDKSITITDFVAKKWMCLQDSVKELRNPEFIEYCKDLRKNDMCNFYLNIKKNKDQVIGELIDKSPLSNSEIVDISYNNDICPYEIACELGKNSKLVISDYYYIFNPIIRQSIMKKMGKELEDSIIIVDEAHNLPSRIRDMLSNKLSTYVVENAIKEAENVDEVLEILQKLLVILETLTFDMNKKEKPIERNELIDMIEKDTGFSIDEIIAELHIFGDEIRKTKKRSFCGSIAIFLEMWKVISESYIRIVRKKEYQYKDTKRKRIEIELCSLDPSDITADIFKQCYSSIVMSGTLSPTYMYKEILGFEKQIDFLSQITDKPILFINFNDILEKKELISQYLDIPTDVWRDFYIKKRNSNKDNILNNPNIPKEIIQIYEKLNDKYNQLNGVILNENLL